MSEVQAAERIFRRFARDTNLLLAARSIRVRPGVQAGSLAPALERMLRDLGASIVSEQAVHAAAVPSLVGFASHLLQVDADLGRAHKATRWKPTLNALAIAFESRRY